MYQRPAAIGEVDGFVDDVKGIFSTIYDVVAGGVTSIPGASDAVAYIKSQVGKFFQLPQRIGNAQRRAARLAQAAGSKRLTEESAQALGVQAALAQLAQSYASTEARLTALLDSLKAAGVGLGALPIALIAVAVSVAGAMAYLFKSVSFQESLLDKIEKKVLTPKEAAALFGPRPLIGFNVPWYVWAGGVGALGYVAYTKFGRRRR